MIESYYLKGVTLLITHYNRSESLGRLLKSFEELNCHFEDIVVSDDGSDDTHLSKIATLRASYNFRLISSPGNRGLGNNLNKGQDAVNTAYTLYVQEDFVPHPSFPEHFVDGFNIMEERKDIDIVRFYAYVKYPYLKPFEKGFSEMYIKFWSWNYLKIYNYSDHPHLRRSSFLTKFGRYAEGIPSDRTEYRMCLAFIKKGGKGLFYNDYKSLFSQINPQTEPSTNKRSILTLSKHPVISFVRDVYRQIRYNYDIVFFKPDVKSHIPEKNNKSDDLGVFRILSKALGLYSKIRHHDVIRELRYFYKDTYYCQLIQLRYTLRDYIKRKRYKIISFDGEFAPELQFVLPFAYWHYKNGTLKKTQSSKFTKELYFFSPEHEEVFSMRTNEGNYNYEIPRILYSQNYNISKWTRVPLKETYRNSIYVYEKPILIIANRYNMEWDGPPLSFLSIPVLSFIIDKLKDRYTIIYNRPKPQNIITDNSEIYDLNEFEWLNKEHPEVILLEDLYIENKGNANNFNHLQLMVYANADHFISTHGGTATLASYFGGINLIFSKQGPEHHFNCYQKLYPQFSGATILHAKTEDQLEIYIEKYYI